MSYYTQEYYEQGGVTTKYRGTITGLRISAVDGTAFVDGANASVTALADGNHEISIYDSSGRALKGVLKAAGSGGGTLSAEKILGWTNHISLGYNTFTKNADTRIIDSAIENPADTALAYWDHSTTMPDKALFCFTASLTLNDGKTDCPKFRTGDDGGADNGVFTVAMATTLASGANTYYRTSNGHDLMMTIWTLGDASFSLNPSYKQILAPSSSGCTVVSAKGGVTYNFTSKDASFAYNKASYDVVVRRLR
jgi:hypothetical protein